ncbi:MAG: ArsR/SmtB family transcription factor [Planctomycetota bacterium]|jgi:DNA-binding transcriptional ArsR family regulator
MSIARAVSDENRVRVLMFLREHELCVCQIIEMLGLAPSTVSKHMAILSAAGLVEARKEGRWTYYRRPARAPVPARKAMAWLDATLGDDPTVRRDAGRLDRVRAKPLCELCRHYARR